MNKLFSKDDWIAVGDRVQEAYKTNNVSEIARLLDIDTQTLHNYFSGRTKFPIALLMQISEEKQVSIDWLLRGKQHERGDDLKILVARKIDGSQVQIDEQMKKKILQLLDVMLETTGKNDPN